MPTDPDSIPQHVSAAAWDVYNDDNRPDWMERIIAAAVDALMDDAAMDRLIEEIIVSLGGERGVTDDRFPLARWDMAHIVRKAVFHAH